MKWIKNNKFNDLKCIIGRKKKTLNFSPVESCRAAESQSKRSLIVNLLFIITIVLQSNLVYANTNATWQGNTNTNLNVGTNWISGVVPNGVATFDNTISPTNLSPTASTLFSVDSFYFSQNASAFTFTLTASSTAGAPLIFTGPGIQGVTKNPNIILVNPIYSIPYPQLSYTSPNPTSLGSANISATSSYFLTVDSGNMAQILLNAPNITADDGLIINLDNQDYIFSSSDGDVGQLLCKQSNFIGADHTTFTFLNEGRNRHGDGISLATV